MKTTRTPTTWVSHFETPPEFQPPPPPVQPSRCHSSARDLMRFSAPFRGFASQTVQPTGSHCSRPGLQKLQDKQKPDLPDQMSKSPGKSVCCANNKVPQQELKPLQESIAIAYRASLRKTQPQGWTHTCPEHWPPQMTLLLVFKC